MQRITNCKICGKEVVIKFDSWDRTYCGLSCAMKAKWATQEFRDLQTRAHKGKMTGDDNVSRRPDVRLKISKALTCRVFSPETLLRMSQGQKMRFAECGSVGHPQWKGGLTKPNKLARTCPEFKDWQQSIFQRDKWACRRCGYKGRKIEAHHIKSFADYPDLRYAIENGITLCWPCHAKEDKYRAPMRDRVKELVLA